MTIYRLLQLPVELGCTHYRTDQYLTTLLIRETIKNVIIVIIDEISMMPNITLLYIHIRVCEI